VCYRQSQWYSQCRPAANGCPAGWGCQTMRAFSTAKASAPQVSVALRSASSVDRRPTVVPIERLAAELSPLQPGLSSQQTLERALELVSALFNAQLAHDLVNNASARDGDAQQPSHLVAALVVLASFCLGVLVALIGAACFSKRRADHVHVGKNAINLVIDSSGVRHQIPPPKGLPPVATNAASSLQPNAKLPRGSVEPMVNAVYLQEASNCTELSGDKPASKRDIDHSV